jgi:SAM-dependent MidA family methyltransferase
LLSPAEMGELFKVLALTRGIDDVLLGFREGDRSHRL